MSEYKKSRTFALWRQVSKELSKAVALSKKMVLAGKTNVELKDTLSELGLKIYQMVKTEKLSLETQEFKNLISKVDYLERLMNDHEGEIQRVKTGEMPSLSK